MKELADQVREYYPTHPESAFQYFHLTYPNIVAVTMVTLVWNYMEFEQMMKTGIKFTRLMGKEDIQLFKSPFFTN